MTDCLYLLHFADPYYHAEHYLGSSIHLADRLADHANGRGSCLTRALVAAGAEWQLAAVYLPRPHCPHTIRELESRAKRRHNSAAYCPICCHASIAPWWTISYPLDSVPAQLLHSSLTRLFTHVQ